jgi:hypothetical protein
LTLSLPGYQGSERQIQQAGPYGEDMGRILLYVVAAIAAFFVIGWLIGMVFTILKWALIIGVIGLGAWFVLTLTRGRSRSEPGSES